MKFQSAKIEHLQKDNLVAIEMTEVMPNNDIKMTSEEGADGIEIVKDPEITINDNDQDRFLLDLVKLNFIAIEYLDYIKQTNDQSNLVSFLEQLNNVIALNKSNIITSFFNLIIADKLIQLLHSTESEDSENNSTDGSSIGDETGEDT